MSRSKRPAAMMDSHDSDATPAQLSTKRPGGASGSGSQASAQTEDFEKDIQELGQQCIQDLENRTTEIVNHDKEILRKAQSSIAPSLISLTSGPIYSQLQDARREAERLLKIYEAICVQIQKNEVSTVVTASSSASGGTHDAKVLIACAKRETEGKIDALVQGTSRVSECSEAGKANSRVEPLHNWGEATDRARKHIRKLTKYFGEEED